MSNCTFVCICLTVSVSIVCVSTYIYYIYTASLTIVVALIKMIPTVMTIILASNYNNNYKTSRTIVEVCSSPELIIIRLL